MLQQWIQKKNRDPAIQYIYLHSTNEIEITNTIKNVKNRSSTDNDEYSSKFIKLSEPLRNPAHVMIFNLVFTAGTYPDRLKILKLSPFSKGVAPTL